MAVNKKLQALEEEIEQARAQKQWIALESALSRYSKAKGRPQYETLIRAEMYVETGQLGKAEGLLQSLLKEDPSHQDAKALLTVILSHDHRPVDSVYPSVTHVSRYAGAAHEACQQWEQALKVFEQCGDEESAARVQVRTGRVKEVRKVVERAKHMGQWRTEALRKLAEEGILRGGCGGQQQEGDDVSFGEGVQSLCCMWREGRLRREDASLMVMVMEGQALEAALEGLATKSPQDGDADEVVMLKKRGEKRRGVEEEETALRHAEWEERAKMLNVIATREDTTLTSTSSTSEGNGNDDGDVWLSWETAYDASVALGRLGRARDAALWSLRAIRRAPHLVRCWLIAAHVIRWQHPDLSCRLLQCALSRHPRNPSLLLAIASLRLPSPHPPLSPFLTLFSLPPPSSSSSSSSSSQYQHCILSALCLLSHSFPPHSNDALKSAHLALHLAPLNPDALSAAAHAQPSQHNWQKVLLHDPKNVSARLSLSSSHPREQAIASVISVLRSEPILHPSAWNTLARLTQNNHLAAKYAAAAERLRDVQGWPADFTALDEKSLF